jgi:dTDP-4-amino-4,6-dideoxygalactose transaminase
VDLKAQYRSIKPEIDAAIGEVLDDAAFILGPAVRRFEERFAAYIGTKHAIGVNSGTSALHLALLAGGVGPGDEVIAPAMTFVATASAIYYTGARPFLVDVDPATFTLDPTKVEAAITPRTKAIMPVHLYGQCADMDPILDTARRHGMLVIEDAAQAHGAKYKGRMAGSMGDLAGFSFYPGKNLGAYGEGGAVTTARDDFARTVRMLRDWGAEKKHEHLLKGFNYRMEGIQGAILGVKLAHLERWTEDRRRAAAWYRDRLAGFDGLVVPLEHEACHHVYHVFAVLVPRRDQVIATLRHAGIEAGIHYPLPVHLLPCFADLGYKMGDFPVAERVAAMELSLPLFPELTAAQVGEVAAVLAESQAS